MKNLMILTLICISNYSFSQTNFKLNLLGGANYSFSEYTYNEGRLMDDVEYEIPLGHTFSLELELELDEKLSIQSGFRYSERNLNPRLHLGFFYGGIKVGENENGSEFIPYPYLANHTFQLISIPLDFKYYFKKGERFSFYGVTGVSVGIQFSETETYKNGFELDGERFDNLVDSFSDQRDGVSLFNTAIEAGFGMNYRLTTDWSLTLQTSAQILEFRNGNEKFKNNGAMYWEDSILPVGEIFLGVGLQKAL